MEKEVGKIRYFIQKTKSIGATFFYETTILYMPIIKKTLIIDKAVASGKFSISREFIYLGLS